VRVYPLQDAVGAMPLDAVFAGADLGEVGGHGRGPAAFKLSL
jgi:hypothetical protein